MASTLALLADIEIKQIVELQKMHDTDTDGRRKIVIGEGRSWVSKASAQVAITRCHALEG